MSIDTMISVCKNCYRPVRKSEPWAWQKRPRIGIIHTGCTPDPDKEAA